MRFRSLLVVVAAVFFQLFAAAEMVADENELDFAAIARSGRSDAYPTPISPPNLLQDFRETDSLKDKLRKCKIKDPVQAKQHAGERYQEIVGAALQADEVLSVTALSVWGRTNYAWCVSVVRCDGRTAYPRVSNRLWINAASGEVTPLVPKSRRLAASDDNASLVSDGNLLPVLAGSQNLADQLKAKLRQSSVPYPQPVRDLERLSAASAAPVFGQVRVAGLIALGGNVKDFGSDGDLIWIVHKAAGFFSLREEIWFNSRNGKTLSFSTAAWSSPAASIDSD